MGPPGPFQIHKEISTSMDSSLHYYKGKELPIRSFMSLKSTCYHLMAKLSFKPKKLITWDDIIPKTFDLTSAWPVKKDSRHLELPKLTEICRKYVHKKCQVHRTKKSCKSQILIN